MKILVIFTGGTIGSQVRGQWIGPDAGMKYLLLENYRNSHDTQVTFDTVEPYRILSENLDADHLNTLFSCVKEQLDRGYDGIIITHGTDTLQYTAAVLQYVFGQITPPMVLVSANYPLTDERSNGHRNFEEAVALLEKKRVRGVYAAYGNDRERVTIHRATRMLSHAEMQDAVQSIEGAGQGGIGQSLGEVRLTEQSGILVIGSVPGDSFAYSLEGVKAVLMRPYHSGTLATATEPLKQFCHRAKEADIPVFLTGVSGGVSYASAELFSELGILSLPKSAFPAMYMKLWLGISLGKELTAFMAEAIADEY